MTAITLDRLRRFETKASLSLLTTIPRAGYTPVARDVSSDLQGPSTFGPLDLWTFYRRQLKNKLQPVLFRAMSS